MRKQYYFRSSPEGLLAWDVDRLVSARTIGTGFAGLHYEMPRRSRGA